VGIVAKVMGWIRGPSETPEHRAERQRIEYDKATIRTSQGGSGRGPGPSTLPPTPDTIDPDR
jgi:hypothetical protein